MTETTNQENNESVKMCSIGELLNYNFVIPSYQRGYRWDEIQVNDLLNDIYEFHQNNNEGFYCLQPLVLKEASDEKILDELELKDKNNVYEVIDGQQRLTTIYLILKYLKNIHDNNINIYTLTYSTRTDSKTFLEKTLTDKELSEKEKEQCIKHIDFEYIYNAYHTIIEWFESNKENKCKKDENKSIEEIIKYILLDGKKVQFIWYEPKPSDNTNAIEIFTRINIGKIPLTNSELIKALFLQKANFVHDENFDEALYEHAQIEIASEWDYIENTLQYDRFWGFINNDMNKKYNRIDYIFEIVSDKLLEKDKQDKKISEENLKEIGEDGYKTFRYFYKKWKDNEKKCLLLQDTWKEIRYCFYAMNKWYHDLTLYHYIGYIIYFSNKKVERFYNIYNLYTDNMRDQFIKELKEIIKNKIINDIDISEINYEDKIKIRKILLLYNIEYMLKNQSSNAKFPFDLFKEKSWDIEHIDPRTTNNLIKKEDKKDWLNIVMEDYKENIDDNIESDIKKYLDDDNKNFEELYTMIVKHLFNNEDYKDDKKINRDNLYNLTLLDSHTNRSYGNSFFKSKRKKIIEEDKKGNFIPICTKNIFLKYFNPNASTIYKYTIDDAETYETDICETLKEFLPKLSDKENL
ncbi:DUF262 domain-containing protein [Brachyspira alvinipulli]|uniref:DUF262 domain-containing protein n=1 Tax=Brachyspira alvinipulli TaxID=84379 RepID=UPI0004B0CA5E|nr:DUF262 domain-containing protein [Brachyspira alvinipulli]